MVKQGDDTKQFHWVGLSELIPPRSPQIFYKMLTYWVHVKGNNTLPQYDAFDPIDIPWALGNIFVVEVVGGEFVYRIASEGHNEYYGRNLKKARLSDFLQEDAAKEVAQRFDIVLSTPAVMFVESFHKSIKSTSVRGIRLLLPFANKKNVPYRIIGITEFYDKYKSKKNIIDEESNIRASKL